MNDSRCALAEVQSCYTIALVRADDKDRVVTAAETRYVTIKVISLLQSNRSAISGDTGRSNVGIENTASPV